MKSYAWQVKLIPSLAELATAKMWQNYKFHFAICWSIKKYHIKVRWKRFHFNGHTIGFRPHIHSGREKVTWLRHNWRGQQTAVTEQCLPNMTHKGVISQRLQQLPRSIKQYHNGIYTVERYEVYIMTFFSPFPPKPSCTFFNPKILHDHCFQFLLGITVIPREIEENNYAK